MPAGQGFGDMKGLKQAELAHLAKQEQELEEQKRKMEEEVRRLQSIVEAAKSDLDSANTQSAAAEEAVKGAAAAFATKVGKPDSLWAHAAAPDPTEDDCAASSDSASEPEKPRRMRKRVIKIKRNSKADKLGLFFSNGTGEITRVFPGYAAAEAGLRAGMTIMKVGKDIVGTLAEVDAALAASGKDLTLVVEEEVDTDDDYEVCDAEASDEEAGGDDEARVDGESEEGFMLVTSPSKQAAQVTKLPASPPKAAAAAPAPAPTAPVVAEKKAEKAEKPPAPAAKAAPKKEEKAPAFNDPYAGMELPEIDLEGFKRFCEQYAKEHPELVAPEMPVDEDEELLRLREERRMRELHEDPTAIHELLMRTMKKDGGKPAPPAPPTKQVEKGLGELLAGDDWKQDYERRVHRTQGVLDQWAETEDAADDVRALNPHSLGVKEEPAPPKRQETFAEFLKRTKPGMFDAA
eukprot:TRINITY_DN21124_c0_g1_i1.p1 TRINITY_DN21124_c0_g1~~TRINITY_DN21124_c0_g1_i1.p1  ORF type:complete len:462 (+),score=205.22 TRINITY_DN21124_c0_g1_i1:60-1445(+)